MKRAEPHADNALMTMNFDCKLSEARARRWCYDAAWAGDVYVDSMIETDKWRDAFRQYSEQ